MGLSYEKIIVKYKSNIISYPTDSIRMSISLVKYKMEYVEKCIKTSCREIALFSLYSIYLNFLGLYLVVLADLLF